ncbi:hypothetical protein, partial [Acetomicrobium sp. S15 = DSM 107314]|uniref:hypothetical protein n=1 Tax=Acetomicrobium sp. S15 = DSM 107314 TaxID=2529858 RepID=UPI0018E16EBD
AQAMLKTLGFLYYIQNELDLPWSVADDEFGSSDAFEAVKGLIPYAYVVSGYGFVQDLPEHLEGCGDGLYLILPHSYLWPTSNL